MNNEPEPAFPSHGTMGEVTHEGMALRDYFAAKAMHGWLYTYVDVQTHPGKDAKFTASIAELSYTMADAMLKARIK